GRRRSSERFTDSTTTPVPVGDDGVLTIGGHPALAAGGRLRQVEPLRPVAAASEIGSNGRPVQPSTGSIPVGGTLGSIETLRPGPLFCARTSSMPAAPTWRLPACVAPSVPR